MWKYFEDHFQEHISLGNWFIIFGFNAMHLAVNIRLFRWWICFHPTCKCFGKWWPWYFYISKDATPYNCLIKLGKGAYC